MKILDAGHRYSLTNFDGGEDQLLTFVKRNEPREKYPGNIDSYSGTQTQEVLRALIDRVLYVNNQAPCKENVQVIYHLREALMRLEERHLIRHNQLGVLEIGTSIERVSFCNACGHIVCFCNSNRYL